MLVHEVEYRDTDPDFTDEENGGKSDSDSNAEGEVRVFIALLLEKAEAKT